MSAVLDYLTLGFVPNPARARGYLDTVLGEGPLKPPPESTSFTDLLTEIIGEKLRQGGFRRVAIPLTGGNDSRAILGAALRLLPTDAITCVTYGPEGLRDVVEAREACARVSVSHRRLDPAEADWDQTRLVSRGAQHFARTGWLAPIDGLVMFDVVARSLPSDALVLSGYLGDASTGRHLPSDEADRSEPDPAIRRFIRWNHIAGSAADPRPLHDRFRAFLDETEPLHADVMPCDRLDLGFRQSHRIRPTVSDTLPNVFRPYEDLRWLSYWLGQPVRQRLEQEHYRAGLAAAFAEVFPTRPRATDLADLVARAGWLLPARVRRALRRRAGASAKDPFRRGDPRTNAVMRATLAELTEGLDRRGIAAERFGMRFAELLREPSPALWVEVKWSASAELYLRAGVCFERAAQAT